MAEYAEGNIVRLTGTFTDADDVALDPTVVKAVIERPDGTKTTYTYGTDPELTRSSEGVYKISLDTTGFPGVWLYRWYSTGTGQAANTNSYFDVIPARPE